MVMSLLSESKPAKISDRVTPFNADKLEIFKHRGKSNRLAHTAMRQLVPLGKKIA